MLRLALVGAGKTVRIGHAPALQALHDQYKVVAIADQDPEALEDAGILLSVPLERRYTEYREMLQREEVDVVSIALPHAYHYEVTMAALQAGAHVITERPLALSLRDAEEVLRMAESHGKLVTVLHYYLYYPPFREAIRLVGEGTIGEPFFARCEGVTGGYGPGTAAYHPAWHADPGVSGGGVWMDSGYHSAYLCVSLLGSPVSTVAARVGAYASDLPVDDTAVAQLVHANGSVSSVQVAWSVPSGGQRVLEVYGTEGSILLDHEGHSLGIYSNATQTWHYQDVMTGHADSFNGLYHAVYECLRFGAPPPVSHRDALHILEVVTAGYPATEESTVERIQEPGGFGEIRERPAA